MPFSLISAVADNNCIGKNNKIPWNIPEDFAFFKKTTLGKTCLMGQATYESIIGYLGKPLPGRLTVVLTLKKNYQVPEGVRVFNSLNEAFEKLKTEDVFVCGGASIYRQTIDRVDTLYITHVHQTPDGDTFFPEINKNIWKETWREDHNGFSFVKYVKCNTEKKYILGALMGLCVGDALGVPAEFKSRKELDKNPITGMTSGGTHNQPAGTWSDDSSLTFCLAESLCKKYDLDDIAKNFCKWLKEGYWTPYGQMFDVGTTTKNAIVKLCDGEIPTLTGGYHEQDNGNGSLMRILPLAFYIDHMKMPEILTKIWQVSSLTHKHKRSIIACYIYISIIRNLMFGLLYGRKKEDSLDTIRRILPEIFCHDWEEVQYFNRILGYDLKKYPLEYEEYKSTNTFLKLRRGDIKSTGYVVDTLEAALWCFFNNNNYKDTVLTAVNLGGDTDTIAAVAGGLAGLYYSFDDIPKEWVEIIARKNDIVDLAERFDTAIKKKEPYIILERFKKIKFRKPTKATIKEKYDKITRNNNDEIDIARCFSAIVYGYPDSKHAVEAVEEASDICLTVFDYYRIHNRVDIFPLSHLCTAVFFCSRANHHTGHYPEPDEDDKAVAKEIIKKIHQIIDD